MLPFLRYKEKESELQKAFDQIPVSVEEITPTDHYYTDGDSTKSAFKVIIDSHTTVYIPQFIYTVEPLYKKLITKWMDAVEKENSFQEG